jgi:hypothetical protein
MIFMASHNTWHSEICSVSKIFVFMYSTNSSGYDVMTLMKHMGDFCAHKKFQYVITLHPVPFASINRSYPSLQPVFLHWYSPQKCFLLSVLHSHVIIHVYIVLQESPKNIHRDSNLEMTVAKTIQLQTVKDLDLRWPHLVGNAFLKRWDKIILESFR